MKQKKRLYRIMLVEQRCFFLRIWPSSRVPVPDKNPACRREAEPPPFYELCCLLLLPGCCRVRAYLFAYERKKVPSPGGMRTTRMPGCSYFLSFLPAADGTDLIYNPPCPQSALGGASDEVSFVPKSAWTDSFDAPRRARV